MAADNEIVDVLVALDAFECGYRLVEMGDGRVCFVWGNIRAHQGDRLALAYDNTCEKGCEWHPNFAHALRSWKDCAEGLRDSGATAAAKEMEAAVAEIEA